MTVPTSLSAAEWDKVGTRVKEHTQILYSLQRVGSAVFPIDRQTLQGQVQNEAWCGNSPLLTPGHGNEGVTGGGSATGNTWLPLVSHYVLYAIFTGWIFDSWRDMIFSSNLCDQFIDKGLEQRNSILQLFNNSWERSTHFNFRKPMQVWEHLQQF